MTVAIFLFSLLGAMAIGMPIAYSLLVCGLALMGYMAGTGALPAFDSQILAQRFVDGADNFRPNRAFKSSSSPEAGISFTGLRRDVTIEDVVAAMGPRTPDATRAPRVLRQAFVLVSDESAPATPVRRDALARIRARFGPYYREATEGRGSADSTLP